MPTEEQLLYMASFEMTGKRESEMIDRGEAEEAEKD